MEENNVGSLGKMSLALNDAGPFFALKYAVLRGFVEKKTCVVVTN